MINALTCLLTSEAVQPVRHQVEDYGGRPLSLDEAQRAGTIVDTNSRETSGAKRLTERIQQLCIVFNDEDVVLPRSEGESPRDGCQDIHMGALRALACISQNQAI